MTVESEVNGMPRIGEKKPKRNIRLKRLVHKGGTGFKHWPMHILKALRIGALMYIEVWNTFSSYASMLNRLYLYKASKIGAVWAVVHMIYDVNVGFLDP